MATGAKFPSAYLLHTAARVLKILGLGFQNRTALRNSYHSTASGGRFPARQLLIAETWLIDSGWLVVDGAELGINPDREHVTRDGGKLVHALVQSILMDAQPSWLATVNSSHGLRFDFVPADAMDVLQSLYSSSEREALLIAAAGKFDEALMADLGALGEATVLAEWRSALQRHGCDALLQDVRHVSLVSDALGYDIVAPRLDGAEMQLEVKCFRGRIPRCYVSRNEFEIGQQLPNWRLVLCRATSLAEATIVGWTSGVHLAHRIPFDRDELSKWHVARITFGPGELSASLPLFA